MIALALSRNVTPKGTELFPEKLGTSPVYSGQTMMVGSSRIFHKTLMSDPLDIFLATAVGTEGEE